MAKCQCGREMLKANGCRFKRIVVHGKNTKSYDRIKVGDPGDWYEEYVGTPEKKISAAAIAEQKSASIITRIAITRDVRFVAASF